MERTPHLHQEKMKSFHFFTQQTSAIHQTFLTKIPCGFGGCLVWKSNVSSLVRSTYPCKEPFYVLTITWLNYWKGNQLSQLLLKEEHFQGKVTSAHNCCSTYTKYLSTTVLIKSVQGIMSMPDLLEIIISFIWNPVYLFCHFFLESDLLSPT